MSKEAQQSPKFPCDYDVPNNAFWSSLDYKVGRNFLQCYNEPGISKMTFNESFTNDEKLKALRTIPSHTLDEKEAQSAPKLFYDADYHAWLTMKFALSTMERYLGDHTAEEAITREAYENGPDGMQN